MRHGWQKQKILAGRVTKNFTRNTTTGKITQSKTEKFWYHLDHLNSTKAVTKTDGSLDCLYEYRAFGEELKKIGAGEAKYTYGGKELDNETNLYYFNARYYDATIGRFINVDPVQDGTNWYVYCGNNPLCFTDPTGLVQNSIQKLATDIISKNETLQKIIKPLVSLDVERNNYLGVKARSTEETIYYKDKLTVNINLGPLKIPMAQTQAQSTVDMPGAPQSDTLANGTYPSTKKTDNGAAGPIIKPANQGGLNWRNHAPGTAWYPAQSYINDPNRMNRVDKPYSAGCVIPITGTEQSNINDTMENLGLKENDSFDTNISNSNSTGKKNLLKVEQNNEGKNYVKN